MDVDMESQGTSQYSSPDLYMLPEEADQGWVSWAWSFVPAIVGTEEEGEEGLYQQREAGGIPSNPQQHTPKDPTVSIGFYCTKASVTFKVICCLIKSIHHKLFHYPILSKCQIVTLLFSTVLKYSASHWL